LAAIRADGATGASMPLRICRACVSSMPIDGASLSLLDKDSRPERVGSSDEEAARVEEIQVTLGEGPVLEAFTGGAPVLVSDLASRDARWPTFAAEIASAETRALFVFPLQIGAVRLGALSLHRREPTPLGPDALSDALRVADVVALLFVGRGGDLTEGFAQRWLDGSSWTREVHQATGILISQLGVEAEEAFSRLRAFAFAHDQPLSDVASAVVAHRVRLADEE
jgi:hypothetical protein